MKTFRLKTVVALCAALTFSPAAIAKDAESKVLDAKAAKSLVSDRMWQVNKIAASGHDYWSWKSDGTVCVRLGERTGKCTDTGTWKLDGERLCYELTWLGATSGIKSACFRVTDQGKGNYSGIQDSGLVFMRFSVVK